MLEINALVFLARNSQKKGQVTERRGQVVSTSASYSGGSGLNLGAKPTILIEIFCGFPQTFQPSARIVL
jgi:hypothetical protein